MVKSQWLSGANNVGHYIMLAWLSSVVDECRIWSRVVLAILSEAKM